MTSDGSMMTSNGDVVTSDGCVMISDGGETMLHVSGMSGEMEAVTHHAGAACRQLVQTFGKVDLDIRNHSTRVTLLLTSKHQL